MNTLLFRLAAGLAFAGVALGAFGAHALRPLLESRGATSAWEKAVLYQLVHAIALIALALIPNVNRTAAWLLVAGVGLFSGSLYAMCLSNVRALGAITPVGGLCFLAGWAWLLFSPSR